MNRRQLKIIRGMQMLVVPIALVMLGAFVLDFVQGGNARISAVWGSLDLVGDVMLVASGGLFWFVFAALLIEFVRQELSGARRYKDLGEPLLELRQTDGIAGVLVVLITMAFAIGLNLILFSPDLIEIDMASVAFGEKLLFMLFYAIAHFLVIGFTLRLIRRRPSFVLTRLGFLYAPGDLSPGLIRWEDVTEIEETELLSRQASIGGPEMVTALVVTLKDPEKYLGSYNPLLRVIDRVSRATVRAQTGGRSDLVLLASDFGGRYQEIKGKMFELARAHRAKA